MKPVVVLALASVLAGSSCARPASAPQAAPTAKEASVRTTTVKAGRLAITVSGFGTVGGGASGQASLAFPQAGRIASVDVTIGQQVAAGAVLARLDPGPLEAEVRQSDAGVAAAQANSTKVVRGSRPQQLAQTDAQIAAAGTQLSVARAKFGRQQKLLRLGIAAQTDVDSAQADVAAAAAALRVLEQQQSAQRTPWAPDVAVAQAGVAQAQAQLSASRQKLQTSVLRAPFDGVVTARLHQNGESVDAMSPVIGLLPLGSAVFTAQFTPADAQRVHPGDPAEVSVGGEATPTRGNVIAINQAHTVDSRTVPVLIDLAKSGITLGPGAFGKASVRVGSRQGVYVPSRAVVADPTTGVTQVFRKDGDRFEPVQVTIDVEASGRTWLATGNLHVGDAVVTQGAYALLAPRAGSGSDADSK